MASFRAWSKVAPFIVFASWLSACAPGDPQNAMIAQSDFAEMVIGLFWQIIWWAAFVFIAVEAVLLYAIWRWRRRGAETTPQQIHGNTRLEIAWTIAPALVLASIAVPTVQVIFRTYDVPTGPDVLTIEAIGHQYWWEYRYNNGAVVTASEMHVPAGRPVLVKSTSADVWHAHWVPKLGIKRDSAPGRVTNIWFKSDIVDWYYGQCSEFCGLQHTNMRLRVRVDTPADFEAWLANQQRPAVRPAPGSLEERGLRAFENGTCAGCHVIEGTRAQARFGPNLTHFGSRTSLAGAMYDNTTENLDRWLENPQAMKPGNLMVVRVIDPEERRALVAYLQSLK
ncbi:MAG: cytochrome c oxidase subunit II [Dehalococcoidia bacterium]|nr:cytochrome c oxidase subunit II [Dehalococcoidia bacterium]